MYFKGKYVQMILTHYAAYGDGFGVSDVQELIDLMMK